VIYFFRRPDNGLIKIGTSLRVSVRLTTLRRETGQPLELLGVMKGEMSREKELHARFSACRREGEWFAPERDLCQYIRRYSRPWVRNDVAGTCMPTTVKMNVGLPDGHFQRAERAAELCGQSLKQYMETAVRRRMAEDAKRFA
jgi:hypothetical protein